MGRDVNSPTVFGQYDLMVVGGSIALDSSELSYNFDSALNIKQKRASLIDVKTGKELRIDFKDEFVKQTKPDDKAFLCEDGRRRSFNDLSQNFGGLPPLFDDEWRRKYLIYGLRGSFIQELMRSILAILWVQRPTHFIVEERPTRWEKKPPKKNTVINSTKKPHFICIAPERIRTTYIKDPDSSPTGRKTRAHQRRGHWRTYSNERYRNLKGKRQWIDAIWVGPQEAVVGKNKYIVRLDK